MFVHLFKIFHIFSDSCDLASEEDISQWCVERWQEKEDALRHFYSGCGATVSASRRGVRRGVSEGVEDGCRPSALRVATPETAVGVVSGPMSVRSVFYGVPPALESRIYAG
jgi:hypothetical protein